jgi:hypothetical protein
MRCGKIIMVVQSPRLEQRLQNISLTIYRRNNHGVETADNVFCKYIIRWLFIVAKDWIEASVVAYYKTG